jgi:hypothetical protein
MPGLGVHGGNDPVVGDLPGDPPPTTTSCSVPAVAPVVAAAVAAAVAVVVAVAAAAAALVLGSFAVDTLRNDPGTFVAIAVILVLAVVLDLVWKRARDRPAGVAS